MYVNNIVKLKYLFNIKSFLTQQQQCTETGYYIKRKWTQHVLIYVCLSSEVEVTQIFTVTKIPTVTIRFLFDTKSLTTATARGWQRTKTRNWTTVCNLYLYFLHVSVSFTNSSLVYFDVQCKSIKQFRLLRIFSNEFQFLFLCSISEETNSLWWVTGRVLWVSSSL